MTAVFFKMLEFAIYSGIYCTVFLINQFLREFLFCGTQK